MPHPAIYPIVVKLRGPELIVCCPDWNAFAIHKFESENPPLDGEYFEILKTLMLRVHQEIQSRTSWDSESVRRNLKKYPPSPVNSIIERTKPESTEYISTKEAAKILGVGVSTLKRWELEGKIRAKKTAGGHRAFHKNDVASLLAKHA